MSAWGRRYLLTVVERPAKPEVKLDHKRITLGVRAGSDHAKRAGVLHGWHKALLHEAIPPLIQKWEPRLGVKVNGYFLQQMKTKWGSCSHRAGNIRLNTELVDHNGRFIAILEKHYPTCRDARAELNDLPLAAEAWGGE